MRGLVGFALLVAALTGCSSPLDDLVCPDEMVPAFRLKVFDSQTSQPVLDPFVVTDNGVRVDTLDVFENYAIGPLMVDGLFDLRVTKEGYADWFKEGIRVEKGRCGPNTVHMDVLLEGI